MMNNKSRLTDPTTAPRGGHLKPLRPPSIPAPLLVGLVLMHLCACAPKKVDAPFPTPKDPFDYSRPDLAGLIEFSNRFGMLPDSARLAICREMELADKEKNTDSRALTLHQAAAQIFLPSCNPSLEFQNKQRLLLDDPETPAEQKQFANLAEQLISRQESQNNALIQAQKKARSKLVSGGVRRKTEGSDRETPLQDEPAKPLLPASPPDDVARKKLEALRNLEKSMDRGLPP